MGLRMSNSEWMDAGHERMDARRDEPYSELGIQMSRVVGHAQSVKGQYPRGHDLLAGGLDLYFLILHGLHRKRG
jgi:hypothetical protein